MNKAITKVSGRPSAVVVDIEGTIASIRFVKDVLFPFAAARFLESLEALAAEDKNQLSQIQDTLGASPFYEGESMSSAEEIAAILQDWSSKDYKDTTLKQLQGAIWRQGYESGALKAPLYNDVLPFLERCRMGEVPVYSYSSGSIEAQQLFYRYNERGDVRPFFSGYFDTTLGPKKDAQSYRQLAEQIDWDVEGIVFYSDSEAEVSAARAAELQAIRVIRAEDKDGTTLPEGAYIETFADQLIDA